MILIMVISVMITVTAFLIAIMTTAVVITTVTTDDNGYYSHEMNIPKDIVLSCVCDFVLFIYLLSVRKRIFPRILFSVASVIF